MKKLFKRVGGDISPAFVLLREKLSYYLTYILNELIFLAFLFIPIAFCFLISDYYSVTKHILVYLSTILALLSFVITKKKVPKISFFYLLVISIVPFWFFTNTFLFYKHNIIYSILDILTFIILSLWFYNLFSDDTLKDKYLFRILFYVNCSVLLVVGYGFLERVGIDLFYIRSFFRSSLLGNPNISAEYLGLCLLMQLIFLSAKMSKRLRALNVLSLISNFSYLLVLLSRSVYIAVLTSVIIIILIYQIKLKKLIPIILIVVTIFISNKLVNFDFVGKYIANNEIYKYFDSKYFGKYKSYQTSGNDNSNSKEVMSSFLSPKTLLSRMDIWKDSFNFIKDNPWGVGKNNFAFNTIPYQIDNKYHPPRQDKIFAHPHNEFVRLFYEFGIVVSIIILCLIGKLIVTFYIKYKSNKDKLHFFTPGLWAFAIYLFIQSFFQFPFQNAYPIFFTSFLLGFLCSELFKKTMILKYYGRCIGFILLGIYFNAFFRFVYAEYYEINFSNYYEVKIASEINPGKWRLKIIKAEIEMANRDFQRTENTLNSILDKIPYNFTAIDMMARLLFNKGDVQKACNYVKKYRSIFKREKNLFSSSVTKRCRGERVKVWGDYDLAPHFLMHF